jgi:hypothetical protein
MYANVNAAMQFFRTYKKHLMERILMKQSLTADPCVFHKRNEAGRTILIDICFIEMTRYYSG